jgi:hypothetical protein
MKSLALFLFMIALASHSLQAQDVVVYTHHETPTNPQQKLLMKRKNPDLSSHRKTNTIKFRYMLPLLVIS